MAKETMLIVPEDRLIGRGNGRACYEHPSDPGLCLKVPHNERGRRESRRETVYLRRAARLHGEGIYTNVSRLDGPVPTNLGHAWVAERVRDDPSGRFSALLLDTLDREALESDREAWHEAFDDFLRWTARSAIVFRDWSSTNLCAKRLSGGGWRLVVIDGFAPKEVLLRWFPTRAHARQRNRHYAELMALDSIERLLALCERERRERDASDRRGDPG